VIETFFAFILTEKYKKEKKKKAFFCLFNCLRGVQEETWGPLHIGRQQELARSLGRVKAPL
jgi:hypothetical protein